MIGRFRKMGSKVSMEEGRNKETKKGRNNDRGGRGLF